MYKDALLQFLKMLVFPSNNLADTDLPSQSENEQEPSGGSGSEEAGGGGDIDARLEQQGEALRAKLAAAVIAEEEEPSDGEIRDEDDDSDPKKQEKELPTPSPPKVEEEPSDGEIRSGEDDEKPDTEFQKKFDAIFENRKEEEEGAAGSAGDITSPISDNMSPLAMSKGSSATPEPITPKPPSGASSSSESDDEKKDDSAEAVVASRSDKKDDESEDQGNGGAGTSGDKGNLGQKEPPPPPPEPGPNNSNDSNNTKSPNGSGGDEKKNSASSSRSGGKDSSSKHGHHSIDSKRRDSSSSSHRKSSSHSSSSKHSSHRHSSSSSSNHKERRKSSSSSSSSSSRKEAEKNGSKDKETSKEAKKKEKEKEKDRLEKEKIRLEKIERKIKEKSNMKSEKFTDFDMFAPKPPKPKTPLSSRPPSSASSGAASPLNPFGAKTPPAWGSKTPPAFGLKTPPAFGNKLLPKESPSSKASSCSSASSSSNNSPLAKFDKTSSFLSSDSKKLERRTSQDHKQHPPVPQTPTQKERVQTPRKRSSEPKLEEIFGQNRPLERKVYPELPVPKDEGDKLKQHEDDIIETKRRLEEARQRRLEEKYRLDLEKKLARRSVSHDSEPKPKKMPKEKTPKPEKIVVAAPTVVSEKKKKKLTLEDLMDDESEVSDWSDIEAPSLKRKKRKKGKHVLEDSSDEEIGDPSAKRQTRKLVQKAEADAILSTDLATENFRFFDDESVEQLVKAKSDLDKYLEDEDSISVSSVCSEDLDDPDELIYLSDVEDAEELRDTLAKYGGNPKVNPNPPRWLHDRLADWGFVRKEVNIFFQNNHGMKRVITEKTFNDRIMKRRAQQLSNCAIPTKRRLTNHDIVETSPTKVEPVCVAPSTNLERVPSPVKLEQTTMKEEIVPAEPVKNEEDSSVKNEIPKNEEISATDINLKEEEEADFYGFGDSDLKGEELPKITSLTEFEIDLKGNTFGMSDIVDSRVLDEIELEDDERSLFGNNDTTKMMVQISPELMGEIQKLSSSEDEAGFVLPPSPVSNKSGIEEVF